MNSILKTEVIIILLLLNHFYEEDFIPEIIFRINGNDHLRLIVYPEIFLLVRS